MSYDYYRKNHTSKKRAGLGSSLGLGYALSYRTSFHQHNQKLIDTCCRGSHDSRNLTNLFLFFKSILQPALLSAVLHFRSTSLPCKGLVLPSKCHS